MEEIGALDNKEKDKKTFFFHCLSLFSDDGRSLHSGYFIARHTTLFPRSTIPLWQVPQAIVFLEQQKCEKAVLRAFYPGN